MYILTLLFPVIFLKLMQMMFFGKAYYKNTVFKVVLRSDIVNLLKKNLTNDELLFYLSSYSTRQWSKRADFFNE